MASWQRLLLPETVPAVQAAVGNLMSQTQERTCQDNRAPAVEMIVLPQGEQVRAQSRGPINLFLAGENPEDQPRLFDELPGPQRQMVQPGPEVSRDSWTDTSPGITAPGETGVDAPLPRRAERWP